MKHLLPLSKNVLVYIFVGAVILAVSALAIVHMQTPVEWLVSVVPTEAYIDQPITFKAYSYSPISQQIFYVTCNLTLINGTDVIWFKKVSGAPAITSFTIDKTGEYTLEIYCFNNDTGNEYVGTETLKIKYPEPSIQYEAYWGRPVNITVTTPYEYNGVEIDLVYQDNIYKGTLISGVAEFTNLPAIFKPETVIVELFGETRNFTLTPETPNLIIELSPSRFVSTATVKTVLTDKFGILPINYPISYSTSGACKVVGSDFKTNIEYLVVSTNNRPLEPAPCTVSVTATLWPGMTLQNVTEGQVLPINVTRAEITYTNTTPWNYIIKAEVDIDYPAVGNLTLYIDGKPVASTYKKDNVFIVSYSVEFYPGLHVITATFTVNESMVTLEPVVLIIPKHPYIIVPPPTKVYAGDPVLLTNAYWYNYIPENNTVILLAYYPGDDYYASNTTLFKVQIIYPEIKLTEHNITVKNVAPGSNIKIYCIVGTEKKLIAELYSPTENYSYTFPNILECDKVEAVYTYGTYKQIVYANEPEPVKILATTCLAGSPCMLLEPSPAIVRVFIGDQIYEPGTSIKLRAGYYTMKIFMRDGYVLTVPIKVEEPEIKVVAYKDPVTGWVVDVRAPPYVAVSVTLKDGRIIVLEPGVHYIYDEPMSAFWEYGTVEFIKAQLLQGFRPEG